jgi:bacterioferritin (cytochrome b1)
MEDTMGIPLTGITNTQPEKTATEILRQQISKESNTANYYNNAYKAVRMVAKIIIQLVNNGEDLKFTLENGPNVITREMKIRQELSALATIMPDTMKPLIAKYFADSLKNDLGDELSRNIIANLPPDVNFVTEAQDPTAIHLMKQMQAQTEATLDEMEKLKAENEQLRQQLNTTQLAMLDNREARILDFNKFQISEANKVAIEEAKLGLDSVKAQADISQQNDKLTLEAEKEMNKTNLEHDKLIANIVKGA